MKDNFIIFLKIAAIFILSMIALATNASVWNCAAVHGLETFYIIISILNVALEGVGIYMIAKWLLKNEKQQ